MDYRKVLDQLVDGELKEFKVEPKEAFDFQRTLRNYEKRQSITGRAMRGGSIIYSAVNSVK
ncbi:hypothetical protein [Lactobacillus sp. LL6]|uniref:hypothetical protein n=1 Tax=Lactobacillus sp. LL6 TaxID=2596827 RepID=UPI00118548B4|nr:hypothetical protein [Lactobacillus sp. LL6]TSO25984.1 hypothetical protein FOD82_02635 [Lactobacillus sp. LL6]